MTKRAFITALVAFCIPLTLLAQSTEGLELPELKKGDIILRYEGFTVKYNTSWLIPDWVAYELTAEETRGEVPRASGFSMDLNYKGKQAMREDYSNTGWDKGHMAPAADMKWSSNAMRESFYLTNICPQDHNLNSGDWLTLEKLCREWAVKFGSVYIVCGPVVYNNRFGKIGEQKVVVPDYFYKAVLAWNGKEYKSIAFVMENTSIRQSILSCAVSVNDVEALVGFNLFAELNDKNEESIESQVNLPDWGLK